MGRIERTGRPTQGQQAGSSGLRRGRPIGQGVRAAVLHLNLERANQDVIGMSGQVRQRDFGPTLAALGGLAVLGNRSQPMPVVRCVPPQRGTPQVRTGRLGIIGPASDTDEHIDLGAVAPGRQQDVANLVGIGLQAVQGEVLVTRQTIATDVEQADLTIGGGIQGDRLPADPSGSQFDRHFLQFAGVGGTQPGLAQMPAEPLDPLPIVGGQCDAGVRWIVGIQRLGVQRLQCAFERLKIGEEQHGVPSRLRRMGC